MPFSFSAKIYKVGINPCVKVPTHITDILKPTKGYIPIKGLIENHLFKQTLVPIKNALYRLYVNGPMLKGANVKLGQTVNCRALKRVGTNCTYPFGRYPRRQAKVELR